MKTRLQVSGDGTNGARNYKALGIRGTVSVIATEVFVKAALDCVRLLQASYPFLRVCHVMCLSDGHLIHFVLSEIHGSCTLHSPSSALHRTAPLRAVLHWHLSIPCVCMRVVVFMWSTRHSQSHSIHVSPTASPSPIHSAPHPPTQWINRISILQNSLPLPVDTQLTLIQNPSLKMYCTYVM